MDGSVARKAGSSIPIIPIVYYTICLSILKGAI